MLCGEQILGVVLQVLLVLQHVAKSDPRIETERNSTTTAATITTVLDDTTLVTTTLSPNDGSGNTTVRLVHAVSTFRFKSILKI